MDIDKGIEASQLNTGCRVALRADSYALHKVLPNKVDPLVSLMMVEKVPDSTYEMIGGYGWVESNETTGGITNDTRGI